MEKKGEKSVFLQITTLKKLEPLEESQNKHIFWGGED